MSDTNSPDWPAEGNTAWWSEPVSRSDGSTVQAFVLDLRPPAEPSIRWATPLHYYGGVCMNDADGVQRLSIVPDPQPGVAEAKAVAMERQRVLAPES